jgi:hypothetical protein
MLDDRSTGGWAIHASTVANRHRRCTYNNFAHGFGRNRFGCKVSPSFRHIDGTPWATDIFATCHNTECSVWFWIGPLCPRMAPKPSWLLLLQQCEFAAEEGICREFCTELCQ